MKINYCQILRWKILNDKLKPYNGKKGVFCEYICIPEKEFLSEVEYENRDIFSGDKPVPFSKEKALQARYSDMIKNGEIKLVDKDDLFQFVPDGSVDGDGDIYFLFKPNGKEKIEKYYAESLRDFDISTGVNERSYEKQREFVLSGFKKKENEYGKKAFYRFHSKDFDATFNVFQCLFKMEQDKIVKVIDIKHDFFSFDVRLLGDIKKDSLKLLFDGDDLVDSEDRNKIVHMKEGFPRKILWKCFENKIRPQRSISKVDFGGYAKIKEPLKNLRKFWADRFDATSEAVDEIIYYDKATASIIISDNLQWRSHD